MTGSIMMRWEPNEEWLGGWEPVECIPGESIPIGRDDEVWTPCKYNLNSKAGIINPSGVALYIEFTNLGPAPGRN
jgi:hypothetical protein